MNCLEKYRRLLVRDINGNLRRICQGLDEGAVHDFRVGMKRLSALFYFLDRVEPGPEFGKLRKPYRSLYKKIGRIRDGHIAADLISSLAPDIGSDAAKLVKALQVKIAADYDEFLEGFGAAARRGIRSRSIDATGISPRALRAQKPLLLNGLLEQFLQVDDMMTAKRWHQKRILLKRYHHIMDAFQLCPGHTADESEFKQIRMLEQLLGDWHDRVVTIEMLRELPGARGRIDKTIAVLNHQDRLLLGAARIYLRKFARWQAAKQSS